jgi:hypothetical protein
MREKQTGYGSAIKRQGGGLSNAEAKLDYPLFLCVWLKWWNLCGVWTLDKGSLLLASYDDNFFEIAKWTDCEGGYWCS